MTAEDTQAAPAVDELRDTRTDAERKEDADRVARLRAKAKAQGPHSRDGRPVPAPPPSAPSPNALREPQTRATALIGKFGVDYLTPCPVCGDVPWWNGLRFVVAHDPEKHGAPESDEGVDARRAARARREKDDGAVGTPLATAIEAHMKRVRRATSQGDDDD